MPFVKVLIQRMLRVLLLPLKGSRFHSALLITSSEFFSGNIDRLSTAMKDNGILVASCRMAVAKRDGQEDMKREKMKRMLNDHELTAKILGAAVL